MDTTTIVGDAIRIFESSIHDVDAKDLDSLSVQDVLDSARAIERDREERHSLCNLRRVEFLLKDLQRLAEVARKLPQGLCPEHYIWGPVKLALEIANENDQALDAILGGYARLTSSLRFLEKVVAIPHVVSFHHEVIAYTLSDVLDFHGRIHQALRRGGWQILFDVSWAELAPVLDCIVKRLEHTSSLVDRASTGRSNVFQEVNISGNASAQLGDRIFEIENATFVSPEDFSAAREFREKILEDLQARQKRRAEHQLLECLEWLDLQSHDRKTMLATYIIEHVKLATGGMMLYYLCSHESQPSHDVVNILLSVLAAQILRSKRHLVPYVFETYVKNADQPALKLPVLLRQLLSCLPTTCIVIDGLNECDSGTQTRIINKLESIVASRRDESTAGPEVRILVSSQEAKGVPQRLLKQPSISLTDEHAYVSHDIKVFTMNTINSLEDRFDQKVVEEIASLIMAKADGMFLWVKLVLLTLLEQESLFEIRTTLDQLPTGLVGIYKILLQRLEDFADSRQKPRIRMIFYWMLSSLRPMKAWEICDALVVGGSNLVLIKDHTMLHPRILDICKPLIEVHKDQTVSFVHFSVRDYLLDTESGPFIFPRDALTHITSTCLKYLFTCEDFFYRKQSIDTYRQIILQLHSLFPYVAEMWKIHFTALATDLSTPSNEIDVLFSSLLASDIDLEIQHKDLRACQQGRRGAAPPSPVRIRTDLKVVRYSILQDLRDASLGANFGEHPTISNEERHDLVKRAFICFQVQFEALLRGQCPYALSELGVSQIDFDLLRERYATAAFLCRRAQCQYSILGFSSIEERARHERSHEKQFCCPELGCDFQNNGFASRAALRNHIQRYHMRQEDSTVPKLVIGRREAAKDNQNQLRNCCICQRNSETSSQTRCEYEDCLHEYCSDCCRAAMQPRVHREYTPVSADLNKSQASSTNLSYPSQTLDHEGNQKIASIPVPQRPGLQMLSDAALSLPPRGSPPHNPWRKQQFQRQQTQQRGPTVPQNDCLSLFQDFRLRSSVKCVDFSPNGKHIATSCGMFLEIFNLETGFKECELSASGIERCLCLCYSHNGTLLATGTDSGYIRIWDIEVRQPKDSFQAHIGGVTSLAYFHGGVEIIASVSINERIVKVWEVTSGLMVRSFEVRECLVSVAVSPDNRYIAAGSLNTDEVFLWDDSDGELLKLHPASSRHHTGIYEVSFSPTGRFLASCGTDGTAKIWEISPHFTRISLGVTQPSEVYHYGCTKTLEGHEDSVISVCFADDDKWVISGSMDKNIRIWDCRKGSPFVTLASHESFVTGVLFSRTSKLLASSSTDGHVCIWQYGAFSNKPG